MEGKISIIYANRNKETGRIRASLISLRMQTSGEFEVIFVDYGSESERLEEYQQTLEGFDFVQYFSLNVPQLLWNKSKALNYGIKKATGRFIFIADVDLIFHPKTIEYLSEIKCKDKFHLFPLGYLDEKESKKLYYEYRFEELTPNRFGTVNGMVLASKEAFLKVNGFDEFFHFYGAEDEDLFSRMLTAGYDKSIMEQKYFLHNYHKSFVGSDDGLLTRNPRVKNIMRINQEHYLRNLARGVIRPQGQGEMGIIVTDTDRKLLESPTVELQINNILAHVEHFLGEELPLYKNQIVKAVFVEDSYSTSMKHVVKEALGRQTQPYCSMKQVNDMLLKEILFRYRNSNYSFHVADNLKSITFCVAL